MSQKCSWFQSAKQNTPPPQNYATGGRKLNSMFQVTELMYRWHFCVCVCVCVGGGGGKHAG
jgi:hypothetical protein